MREIKFRAWDKKIEQIVEVLTISWRCGHVECVHHAKDHKGGVYLFNGESKADYELMQYTGLKDKNGVEIYEGDIVRNGASVEKVEYGTIECANGNCHEEDWFSIQAWSAGGEPIGTWFEIIGNIYENPELLSKDK